MSRGILAVVSGFSGAGKGTIVKRLTEHYDTYALSVSATTRAPRTGEADGREYFFVSPEKFENMIENGELIEYAQYVDNYYGTPKAYVEEQLEAGKDVILEIEIQGARRIREMFPDALLLFVTPPDARELQRRLESRGTESAETIRSRLVRANEEAERIMNYDYLVINDDLEECVCTVHSIIRSERLRPARNRELIARLQRELVQIMEPSKQSGKENRL